MWRIEWEQTGIIMKENSVEGLVSAIKKVESGKIDLKKMSRNCIEESKKYSLEVAMEILKGAMDE